MTKDEILVVKVNAHIKPDVLRELQRALIKQKETGVIVVPAYMEAQVISGDIEMRVIEGDFALEDDFPNCQLSGCEAVSKDCHETCPYGKRSRKNEIQNDNPSLQ